MLPPAWWQERAPEASWLARRGSSVITLEKLIGLTGSQLLIKLKFNILLVF